MFRRPPAAERWPSGGGGFSPKPEVISYADFVALQRANGELGKVASSAGLTATLDPLRDPGVAAGGGGVVGASSLVDGALGDSTPLGGAQPFEYVPDALGDDSDLDAGVFLTPAEEAECEIQLNMDMDECSAWYAAKPSSWGTCRERAMQRYANCLRGKPIA